MSARSLLGNACPLPVTDRDVVMLGHGSGGRLSLKLLEERIVPALRNPILERLDDGAVLEVGSAGRIAFTTDSFVVSPIFFPGGSIGDLAVNGTINDLAMCGAAPIALSVALILEEGFPMSDLDRVLASVRGAAEHANVPVVTGDTKVVGRGAADGIFVTSSGIGRVADGTKLGPEHIEVGDVVIVSGTVGDHGVAVLGQRHGLEIGPDLTSDTAPLHDLVSALLAGCSSVRAMRDPTRGGLAASLFEIASRQRLGITIDEDSVPVRQEVRAFCDLLGLDPWLVANEGKVVAFVGAAEAGDALRALRAHPLGRNAARIGTVTAAHPGSVVVRTTLGAERVVDLPLHEPLPRIC